MKSEFERRVSVRKQTKDSLPTFEKYLKLLETNLVILNKIRDMKTMDSLLRIFFLNFTIMPGEESFKQGSQVTYKFYEPWDGFIKLNKFVCGAPPVTKMFMS